MNILILYWKPRHSIVSTHDNHLFSFRRYEKEDHFYYYNCDSERGIHKALCKIPFDAVIFHYTFLALRFDQPSFWAMYEKIKTSLANLSGIKVLIPHDEYVYTRSLWAIIRDCDVQRVYSSCFGHDHAVIFPEAETGKKDLCHPVFTGYIDERMLKWVERRSKLFPQREIDVGYRAASANYAFGFHGQLKTRLAEAFHECVKRHPGLREDVKLTYMDSYKNTITGKSWFDFLLRCRTALGCLGGSSILDPDGEIRRRALQYVKQHPHPTKEEIAENCYGDQEGRIRTYILGPRVFECAMTRTCQLMVEGDYFGVLEPNVHYIPIKADFSNLDEVLDLVEHDKEYCEQIAQQCYEHVVASGSYTYRSFASEIVQDIRALAGSPKGQSLWGNTKIFLSFYAVRFVVAASWVVRRSLRKIKSGLRRLYGAARKNGTAALHRIAPQTYERLRACYRSRKRSEKRA